jgi:hypothetical protein
MKYINDPLHLKAQIAVLNCLFGRAVDLLLLLLPVFLTAFLILIAASAE